MSSMSRSVTSTPTTPISVERSSSDSPLASRAAIVCAKGYDDVDNNKSNGQQQQQQQKQQQQQLQQQQKQQQQQQQTNKPDAASLE
jgi:transcription initiation factor TFIID subunit TAF12